MDNPKGKRFIWCREHTYQQLMTLSKDSGLSLAIIVGNLAAHAYDEVYGSVDPGDRVRPIFLTKFPRPAETAAAASDPPGA